MCAGARLKIIKNTGTRSPYDWFSLIAGMFWLGVRLFRLVSPHPAHPAAEAGASCKARMSIQSLAYYTHTRAHTLLCEAGAL